MPRTCRSARGTSVSVRPKRVRSSADSDGGPGQRRAGERSTGGSPGKKARYVAFASFHGVSFPITADSSSQLDIMGCRLGRRCIAGSPEPVLMGQLFHLPPSLKGTGLCDRQSGTKLIIFYSI